MADSPIQQFMNHQYRNWIVAGLTAVLILVIGLPAYERLSGVLSDHQSVAWQINEIEASLKNLDRLRATVANVEAVSADHSTIDEERALELRGQVVRLVQEHECRVLNIRLDKSQSAPWFKDQNPFVSDRGADEEDPDFKLLKTGLNLTAEGSLKQISELVDRLSKLHEFAVPTFLQLQQTGEANRLEVEMRLTLLNLQPVKT